MSSNYKLVFGVVVGAALGAAAIQGLHAQAKPKAYTVSELETLDAAPKPRSSLLSRLRKRLRVVAVCALAGKDCCIRGGGSQACSHHRVGQPGAGGGILQIESLE